MNIKKLKRLKNRLNRDCAYFPCHSGLQDCTFCWCPFYPCVDERMGGRYLVLKNKRRIWSCKDCNWIHKKKVVDKIFSIIRRSQSEIWPVAAKPAFGKAGVIILGHGSKIKAANDAVHRVAQDIKKRSGLKEVEPAYLQLCRPDIRMSIKKLAKAGCGKIFIVPFFLYKGNHVTKDIPDAIKKEAKIYKKIKFVYTKNIGSDPRINDIVWDCLNEAAFKSKRYRK